MDTNNVTEDPVIQNPRIIFVKEYKSNSAYHGTNIENCNTKPKDERILVTPLNLEDDISINSFKSSNSLEDNEPIESDRNSEIISKFVGLITPNRIRFVLVVFLCIMSFLSLTLIPYHNVILLPFYWYESIFILVLELYHVVSVY